MTVTSSGAACPSQVHALLDASRVAELLRATVPIRWPEGVLPHDVRIERYWPAGEAGFLFEWSFKLALPGRYVLFGWFNAGAKGDQANEPKASRPRVDEHGLRGLWIHVPQWHLTIHSPDCDPKMPHLGQCLDPAAVAEELTRRGILNGACDLEAEWLVKCRLVGYRAGRRAAIRYHTCGSHGDAAKLVGKTYRNGSGAELIGLHNDLNDALGVYSGGRVRVPAPVAYVDGWRMALFSWAPGGSALSLHELGERAIDALSTLHCVAIDGLPEFTLADECAILERWARTIRQALPGRDRKGASGAVAESLLNTLLARSETVAAGSPCTIHRDYYEKQLICTERTTTILDLDTLARGHACVDLGNLLAHLYLRMLSESDSNRAVLDTPPQASPAVASRRSRAGTCRVAAGRGESRMRERTTGFGALASALVARYEERCGRVDHDALRFYLASSLYRLGAVHALRTTTGLCAEAMWDYGFTLLSGQDATAGKRALVFDPKG